MAFKTQRKDNDGTQRRSAGRSLFYKSTAAILGPSEAKTIHSNNSSMNAIKCLNVSEVKGHVVIIHVAIANFLWG